LIKALNPTWQDLAKGWGEKTELQIPRFTRDDKEFSQDGSDLEELTRSVPGVAAAQRNSK
jgi:hypothetical protein